MSQQIFVYEECPLCKARTKCYVSYMGTDGNNRIDIQTSITSYCNNCYQDVDKKLIAIVKE